MDNLTGKVIWSDSNRGVFKLQTDMGKVITIEVVDFIDIEVDDTISGELMNDVDEALTLFSEHNEETFKAQILDIS